MNDQYVDSRAFDRALLESERRRIYGITLFLLIFASGIVVRILVFGSHMNPMGLLVLAAVLAYEMWLLWTVTKAQKTGETISDWVLYFSILFELVVPMLGIAFFSSPKLLPDYRAIATPWVLALFPLIMLSVLRLDPRVSQLSGVVAATGYMVSAWWLGWRLKPENLAQHTVMETAVIFYALILLASGFIAGLISSEIRKHVAAALHEAEIEQQLKQVEHDLEIARSIQQSLLPRIQPTVAGLEISGWNLPADATGGDYFDWRQMKDGRMVVMLADVTGHGIGPALLASLCRAYARSSFDTHPDLVNALQHINYFFGQDAPAGRFATFVAAVCSGDEEGRVELFSAGHGPLFAYSSVRDSFEKFGAQALPLGLLPELNPDKPLVLHLETGDIIVLVTDGFFEWENAAGEEFGIERLESVVHGARHLPPAEIIQQLYNAVNRFAGGARQMDDLTAVVIKRVAKTVETETAPIAVQPVGAA